MGTAPGSYGLPQPTSIVGEFVASVSVSNAGTITINYNSSLGGTANGTTVTLTPDTTNAGSIIWDCQAGSMPSKYLPATCRS